MKRITLFAILAIIGQSIFAQEKEVTAFDTKNRIYIGYAASIPGGDFAATSSNEEGSGFAKTGRHINLGYHYHVSDYHFVTFEYRVFGYSVDLEAFADKIELNNQPVSYEFEAAGYIVGALTLGYKYLYGEKVKVFVNPFIGYGNMIAGERDFTISRSGRTTRTIQGENELSEAVLYGLNSGLEFRVTELININLVLGFAAAKFKIEAEVEEIDSFNGTESRTLTTAKYDQPYSSTNIGIEVGFNF